MAEQPTPERGATSGPATSGPAPAATDDPRSTPPAEQALGGSPSQTQPIQPEQPHAVVPSFEAAGLAGGAVPQWRVTWRRFRRHRLAMASLTILVLVGLACLLAPWIAPKHYAELDTANRFAEPGEAGYLLGTDSLGRDQVSRLLYGGRVSLMVGISVALIAALVGTTVGALTGYFGGWLDNLLMRTTDLFLAIPFLVFLIMMSRLLGGSISDIIIVLSLIAWMPLARIVRGLFLSLKEKEFVEAARSIGAPNRRIILRHILPNCLGPIIVNLTLGVAAAILAESALSFLGYGIQPPTPTWGNMLAQSREYTRIAAWLVWFPGMCILVTVLAVNYLGDGLRDAFDPSQRRVRG